MPELPEVETIVRELRSEIVEKTILSCQIPKESYLRGQEVDTFAAAVTGKTVTALDRRGKYIIWRFAEGGGTLSHLGMTGKYVKLSPETESPKHTVARLGFGEFDLILEDARRFGRLLYFDRESEVLPLQKMGAEPFSPEFNGAYILEQFKNRKRAVKELLLDQTIIAGLGNIYASEILFRAKLHPLKSGETIDASQAEELVSHTRKVLEEAIAHNGTTISDYKRVDEKSGEFQNFLQVYDKEGQPCPICGDSIKRIVTGGRSAYYCERCQKKQQ